MWPNVHRGERLYISPYKESADIMFDSCLPFEFSVLKPIVTPLLEALPAGKFPEADAMLAAFRKIEPMDEAYVAPGVPAGSSSAGQHLRQPLTPGVP